MALPVVVPVGDDTAAALREKLVPAIEKLRVGISTDPDARAWHGTGILPERIGWLRVSSKFSARSAVHGHDARATPDAAQTELSPCD